MLTNCILLIIHLNHLISQNCEHSTQDSHIETMSTYVTKCWLHFVESYSHTFQQYMYLMITFYHKPSVMVVSVDFSLRINIIYFIFGWKIASLSCVQYYIYQQNFSTVVIKNIFRDINFTVKTFKSSYKVIHWLQCLFLKTYSNASWAEWNNLCIQSSSLPCCGICN
jgi:hypothetical protein